MAPTFKITHHCGHVSHQKRSPRAKPVRARLQVDHVQISTATSLASQEVHAQNQTDGSAGPTRGEPHSHLSIPGSHLLFQVAHVRFLTAGSVQPSQPSDSAHDPPDLHVRSPSKSAHAPPEASHTLAWLEASVLVAHMTEGGGVAFFPFRFPSLPRLAWRVPSIFPFLWVGSAPTAPQAEGMGVRGLAVVVSQSDRQVA